jgi:hypothetical protein
MRITEAPKHFNISRATLYRAAQKGDVTLHKRCRTRVDTAQVRDWLTRKEGTEQSALLFPFEELAVELTEHTMNDLQ